tara:strand:- start:942 stop:1061 length:120 start_codon:yes stop_codon:yes gene_type:complete
MGLSDSELVFSKHINDEVFVGVTRKNDENILFVGGGWKW